MAPLVRLVLYIVVCLGCTVVGSIPAVVMAVGWKVSRGIELERAIDVQRDVGLLAACAIYAVYPLIIGVTIIFVRHVDYQPLSMIGLRSQFWARELALGLLVGAGFVALLTGVYLALGWIRLTPVRVSMVSWILVSVTAYPLIGAAEEIAFRGYLLRCLDEWRGRRMAISVTTVLFWSLHLGSGNMNQPLGIAAMLLTGLLFAFARYGSGALWFPIGLHAAYDWALLSLAQVPEISLPSLYATTVTTPHWLVGPPGHAGLADVIAAALLATGLYLLLYRPSQLRSQAPTTVAPSPGAPS